MPVYWPWMFSILWEVVVSTGHLKMNRRGDLIFGHSASAEELFRSPRFFCELEIPSLDN